MSLLKNVYLAFLLILILSISFPGESFSESGDNGQEEGKRFNVEVELDAYYSNIDLFIPLTDAPIPQLGEKSESDIYKTLISKALSPRFLVLEANVNPMPNLGVYLKAHETDFYNRAQVSGSFNWVKAVTAGFEEPYGVSAFIGDVVDFDMPGSKDTKGKGYIGFLYSAGNFHIKDNELISDHWQEFEWKIKGDRKSPIKKLNWSFRVGTKIHSNHDITDILYFSMRRSRVDYKPSGSSIFNNSGFEYTFDMDSRDLGPMRHYFFVDKKWPLKNRRMAFAIAAGFVWESANKYSGALYTSRASDDVQVILRPNIEF